MKKLWETIAQKGLILQFKTVAYHRKGNAFQRSEKLKKKMPSVSGKTQVEKKVEFEQGINI